MNKIFNHKWFPRLFYTKPDGGEDSGVTGYFLIEWKPFFSIGLLRFSRGTREVFHNHAFNAVTFWLEGAVNEEFEDGSFNFFCGPSLRPKITKRTCFHRVNAIYTTWALTIRGPWLDYWREKRSGKTVILTHGRELV